MFEKLKQIIKQWKCRHRMDVVRWHWVHFPDYEPLSIEVEYKCKDCGKIDYLYLYGKEADEWAKSMGNYKKQ